jgi:uncharacterized membrane protein
MSLPKRLLLYVMSAFYVFAGVNHFRDPGFYLPMMPPYLPWHAALVALSGVAEIGLGLALLVPAWRRFAAWGVMALLVAVFPANLHIALHDVPIGGRTEGLGIWNWVRLPFQLPLLVWAWWYTRPDGAPAGDAQPDRLAKEAAARAETS